MAMATGQFTIIDYNDALTLTGFIGSNHPKTQMYNPDNSTYSPDWGSKNLVLTPTLYKMGSTADIIATAQVQNVKWYEVNSGTETLITASSTYALSGTKSHILTVKSNVLAGLPAKDFTCIVTYRDTTTNMDLTYKMGISFSRVVNGGGIADAVAWCPKGNVFKNGDVATLTAEIDLWRGSTTDITNVAYQWYMQDSTVTTDQGGGVGWKKLTDASGKYTGTSSRVLTVYAASVVNYAVFKCSIKDTDSSSNTYNQLFWDSVTFIDNSDPLQITIESTGGDVFKNGVGSTTLKAKVFQAGNEVDSAGTKYTYKWFKYNKDGTLVTNWGGSGVDYKTGKSINIGSADVDVKATFQVEIN